MAKQQLWKFNRVCAKLHDLLRHTVKIFLGFFSPLLHKVWIALESLASKINISLPSLAGKWSNYELGHMH